MTTMPNWCCLCLENETEVKASDKNEAEGKSEYNNAAEENRKTVPRLCCLCLENQILDGCGFSL
jgi:hypothetical protein